ncbi:MAG: flagellar filament capping protein FliD [Provencibacterium sp.]|nr:flagellar filament capping protein FliD [Provencibacterium sp.]
MFGYNSIGSSMMNSIGWYSQINNMRLIQALNKNSSRSVGSVSSAGSLRSKLLNSDSADFLKSYQSKMTDMMSKANALRSTNSQNALNNLSVSSSDTSKISVSAKYSLRDQASYQVDVKKLATEQMNFTQGYDGKANDVMSGQLTIATNYRASPITINVDSITGATNEEKLQKIANEVNHYKAGVSAMVIENGGKKLLALYSDETGAENAFNVSGSFAEQTGLNKAEQEAGNAEYTVSKDGSSYGAQRFQSASNTVQIGGYKITATLKDVGKSTVTVGTDPSKTADAVKDMIDSYNSTLKFLDDNSNRGLGVLNQMKRMVRPPISERSMKTLGITANKDGTLSFDKEVFTKAMAKSPSLVNSLVSGPNGLAEGIYSDARSGMNVSSASLTGENLTGSRYSGASYMQNAGYSLMGGTYSRAGTLRLLNLNSVGALMNFFG